MIAFIAWISACEKGQQRQRAPACLGVSRRSGLQQGVITFGESISASEKSQQRQRALAFVEEWRHSGLQHGVITCVALISTCEKGQQSLRALAFLVVLRRSGLRQGVSPSASQSAPARRASRCSERWPTWRSCGAAVCSKARSPSSR